MRVLSGPFLVKSQRLVSRPDQLFSLPKKGFNLVDSLLLRAEWPNCRQQG